MENNQIIKKVYEEKDEEFLRKELGIEAEGKSDFSILTDIEDTVSSLTEEQKQNLIKKI